MSTKRRTHRKYQLGQGLPLGTKVLPQEKEGNEEHSLLLCALLDAGLIPPLLEFLKSGAPAGAGEDPETVASLIHNLEIYRDMDDCKWGLVLPC